MLRFILQYAVKIFFPKKTKKANLWRVISCALAIEPQEICFSSEKQNKGKTKLTESITLVPDIKAYAAHALIDGTSSVYFLLNTVRASQADSRLALDGGDTMESRQSRQSL